MTTPLGVQLYSVRDDIGPDALPATLARLASLGFTHVEPYDILGDTEGLAAALATSGLRATTAHSKITELDRDAVLAAATRLGVETVIVPWVRPDSIATREGVSALAAAINAAAVAAAEQGSGSAITTTISSSRRRSTAFRLMSFWSTSWTRRSSSNSTPTGRPSAVPTSPSSSRDWPTASVSCT